MVPCTCWIRTGTTEHHQSDSAAVQYLLWMAAHQRSNVSSCGSLGAGLWDVEWALGVARGTDARTSDMKQCLWGQHRWWDISVCHASSVSSFRSSLKTSFHKSFLSFLCPEICAWQLIHVRSNLYPLDSWYTPDLMCTGQLVHVGSNLYPLDSWYTLDLTAQLI